MTDKELLELAAKAIGGTVDHGAGCITMDGIEYEQWNPLEDSGDALNLAVQLGLEVKVDLCDDTTRVNECDCEFLVEHKHFDGGAEVATRRAIVRAAALISNYVP